ncbi:MAG: M20 family metallopeptidase [Clostridia bacterium]|mgnify:CR=1 FL=1|nr:M20 family metallopeptidase [Clostridia bacterium]
MSQILKYLEQNKDNIFNSLERYVKKESPSNRKDLTDKCGQFLQDLFMEYFGIKGEVFAQEKTGNHHKFTYGIGDEQILILCHMDTVWDEGQLPFKIEGNKAYGPGIFDMKGGAIQAIWAVKALQDLNIKLDKKVVFLFNSDEEIGSPTSRPIIEEEAKKSKVVLVAEPPEENTGALKTARKGLGIFQLKVKGVAAHAGNHHDQGINALEELAHQILYLQSLTDYSLGSTVSVGVARGGTRCNVVPAEAYAEIDFRVTKVSEAERLEKLIRGLTPKLKGTSLEITGEVNRPPMERTAITGQLVEKAQKIAQNLGYELTETSVGGGSDGNFTAALGIPTIDGLGAFGAGPHAEHEHIIIDELPRRTALIAHLLQEL